MQVDKNVGLKEIAAELQLSINSVSRALRDCSDISEKTKVRVRNKAIELGYVPNAIAQSLKNGRSKQIAIIIDNILNPYFSIMIEKIIVQLKKKECFGIIIPIKRNSLNREVVAQCISQRLDGIITFVEPKEEAIELAKLNRIDMILLGRLIDSPTVKCIYTDDKRGGELAGEYLINKNHRKILYVGYKEIECSNRRLEGLKAAIDKANENRSNEEKIELSTLSFLDLSRNLKKKVLEGFDGIFSFNDQIYCQIYKIAHKEHLKIEAVGYDALSKRYELMSDVVSIDYDYDAMVSKIIKILMENVDKTNEEVSGNYKFDVCLYIPD